MSWAVTFVFVIYATQRDIQTEFTVIGQKVLHPKKILKNFNSEYKESLCQIIWITSLSIIQWSHSTLRLFLMNVYCEEINLHQQCRIVHGAFLINAPTIKFSNSSMITRAGCCAEQPCSQYTTRFVKLLNIVREGRQDDKGPRVCGHPVIDLFSKNTFHVHAATDLKTWTKIVKWTLKTLKGNQTHKFICER